MVIIEGIKSLFAGFAKLYKSGGTQNPELM
jgi:hypothetical protein